MIHARAYDLTTIGPSVPEGFRLSLGGVDPGDMTNLYRLAFNIPKLEWEANPDTVGLLLVRRKDIGQLVAATSVVRPMFIHQFAVHPDYQKQGIGAALLESAVSLFELRTVLIETDEFTTPAGLHFWGKQGFLPIGTPEQFEGPSNEELAS